MTITRFRWLLAFAVVANLWWYALPAKWNLLPQTTRELLRHNGTNALIPIDHPIQTFSYYAFYGSILGAGIGLALLKRWGRTLLVVHVVIALLIALASGVIVVPAFDGFIGSIAATLTAVILGISFSEPVSTELRRRAAPVPESTDTPSPEETDLVLLLETGDASRLAVIKSWLTASGIEFVVSTDETQDYFAGGRLGGHNFALGPTRLYVRAEDADSARAFIDDVESAEERN